MFRGLGFLGFRAFRLFRVRVFRVSGLQGLEALKCLGIVWGCLKFLGGGFLKSSVFSASGFRVFRFRV